jgi:hypothetical protein
MLTELCFAFNHGHVRYGCFFGEKKFVFLWLFMLVYLWFVGGWGSFSNLIMEFSVNFEKGNPPFLDEFFGKIYINLFPKFSFSNLFNQNPQKFSWKMKIHENQIVPKIGTNN